MPEYNYTEYFENEVLRKRPYLKKEWCIHVIENPIKVEVKNITVFDFGEKSLLKLPILVKLTLCSPKAMTWNILQSTIIIDPAGF